MGDCKTIASCMESAPRAVTAIEDDGRTQERRGRSSRDPIPEENEEDNKERRAQDGTNVLKKGRRKRSACEQGEDVGRGSACSRTST